MRPFLGIFLDSIREALFRRSLFVVVFLTGVAMLVCGSLRIQSRSPGEALQINAHRLGEFSADRGFLGGKMQTTTQLDLEVGTPRPVEERDALGPEFHGGLVLPLHVAKLIQVDSLVSTWESFQDWTLLRREEARSGWVPPPRERRYEFLTARFRSFGYEHVQILDPEEALLGSDEADIEIAVRSDHPLQVEALYTPVFFFGTVKSPWGDASLAQCIVALQLAIADVLAGVMGMLIFLSVACSFIPNMLQKGTLELLLARPLRRSHLLLAKYFSGVLLVFLLAGSMLGACWLTFAFTTGFWDPWFLACTFTLTATFAVLYAVAVLVGLLTRSESVSGVAAVGVWGLSFLVVNLRHAAVSLFPDHPWVLGLLDRVYQVIPKTADLTTLNTVFLSRALLSPEAADRLFSHRIPDVNWWFSGSTTVLFTVLMLGAGMFYFSRKDC